MSDAIKEAQQRYQDSLDCLSSQRRQIEEDLRFSDPSSPEQWDAREKAARESDPGGARPCLVFDQCGQYVANVAGQTEQRPPSLHAIPAAGGADRKVAEQLDGFFRHIEYSSRAVGQHYPRVLTSAARVGVGYLIVRPEFTDLALNYQEPRISSEGDPLRVVFDPWSVELDGSDATHGYVLTPFSHREFERKWGKKAEKVSFTKPSELRVSDERESIDVVEHWCIDDYFEYVISFIGIDGQEESLCEDDFERLNEGAGGMLQVLGIKKRKTREVKWSVMSGAAMLEDEREYPADGIGIVPVYGYVGISDGRMKYCGIPRRAMSAQRSYNYHQSEIRAYMMNAPKAPWLVPIEGMVDQNTKEAFDRASVESRAALYYKSRDLDGTMLPPPSRAQVTINLQNHLQGAEQALKDIQASIGMYQANLGAPSNESSGVAIESRKQQGEASTSHFPAHLAASLGQVGKLCMQMIPRLIDTRRQVRILGLDNSVGKVIIDPAQPQAAQRTPEGLVINPNVGQYDVRIVVGASFSTQRNQTQVALSEVMGKNPALTPAIAPLWAGTLDIPNADKLAQVLTAVAPPEVRAILQPEDDAEENPAMLTAKVQQLSQALEEALMHAKEAQSDDDEDKARIAELEAQLADKAKEIEVRQYDAETKRLQVTGANEQQIQAIVGDLVNDIIGQQSQVLSQQLTEMLPQPDPEAEDMDKAAAQALIEGQQALGQAVTQVAQGQQALDQRLVQLMGLVARTRERIPVRNKMGDIERVIDRMADEPAQEQQTERMDD